MDKLKKIKEWLMSKFIKTNQHEAYTKGFQAGSISGYMQAIKDLQKMERIKEK